MHASIVPLPPCILWLFGPCLVLSGYIPCYAVNKRGSRLRNCFFSLGSAPDHSTVSPLLLGLGVLESLRNLPLSELYLDDLQ